jgi:hypothetical protein
MFSNKPSISPRKSSKTHKACKTLARPVLTYGSEAWTIGKKDKQRTEMKFMRRTARYSLLDHMRNEHIVDKMKVTSITQYINNYRQNWLQHVKRMDRARIPKQIFRYAQL